MRQAIELTQYHLDQGQMNMFVPIQTIAQVHQLLGLPKPQHPLVSVVDNQQVCFKADIADDKFIFELYTVAVKSGITGSFGYGRNSYDFEEGTMVFTSPGQVITNQQLAKAEPSSPSWTLLFHPDLIRQSELGKTIETYAFFSYEVHEALHLSQAEKNTLWALSQTIKQEASQGIDRHTQKLVVATINLLLDYCTRYFDRQFYLRTNLNKDIVTRFENLLRVHFSSDALVATGLPTVQYCGNQLGLSPNYLSDLLRKETGRNAQDHIHAFVIEKAKTYLLGSSLPVSQIAYALGLQYPQHFSKLFKHKTGMSPSAYRDTK